MIKRSIIAGIIILGMISITSASVRPTFVEIDQFGLKPSVWLAFIVGACALIDNIGKYTMKKKEDPTIKYDYAYLKTTGITIILMCTGTLLTPVVALTELAVLNAILLGLGGNRVITEGTKVKTTIPQPKVEKPGDTE